MAEFEQRRLTAIKTDLKTIQSGTYVKHEGFNPNYVQVGDQKLSRVRVLGTILSVFISEDGNFGSVVLDDSTDTTRLKVFKDMTVIKDLTPGDLVDVIGKVREYQDEKYIIPEIVTKVKPGFELLRKVELKRTKSVHTTQPEDQPTPAPQQFPNKDTQKVEKKDSKAGTDKDKVLDIIVEIDDGEGAEYSEILEKCELPPESIDKAINELLSEGTCFEPRPGRIKKL